MGTTEIKGLTRNVYQIDLWEIFFGQIVQAMVSNGTYKLSDKPEDLEYAARIADGMLERCISRRAALKEQQQIGMK
jgi:hypothetical protein